MGDAETLPIFGVEQRAAIGAFDDMVCDYAIASSRRRLASPTIFNPLTSPASASAHSEAPHPMLRGEQLGIGLLWSRPCCPRIVQGEPWWTHLKHHRLFGNLRMHLTGHAQRTTHGCNPTLRIAE